MNEEVRRTGEALRALFARERRAISTLDAAALEQITAAKVELVNQLAALRSRVLDKDPETRDLFEQLRIEAQASALLVTAATQAIRDTLGYAPANVYDRRARHQMASAGRVLARY